MEKPWKVFTRKKDIEITKDEESGRYEAHDGGTHFFGNNPDDVLKAIQGTHGREAQPEWQEEDDELREFLVKDLEGNIIETIQAKNYVEAGGIVFSKYGSKCYATDQIYPTNHSSDDYEV
jgi:hypothetical protein